MPRAAHASRARTALAAAAAFAALGGCSRRGCAWAVGHAPERGVDGLDPVAFDVYLPRPPRADAPPSPGRLVLALDAGAAEMCPRLPPTTTFTLNGAPGTTRTFGGATGTKRGEVLCRDADAFFATAPGMDRATSTVEVDDGAAHLACTLDVGLPLRVVTPRVALPAAPSAGPGPAEVPVVVELGAGGGRLEHAQVEVGAEGEILQQLVMPEGVHLDGARLTVSVPAAWLRKGGPHRLVVQATIGAPARCEPPRRTTAPSRVHASATLRFDVTP